MLPVLVPLALVATALGWYGWSTNDTDLVMGLNIGSYFIPEQWMMQQYFECYANGTTDTWSLQSLSNVSDIMIKHLDNYIREVDFSDAQARGVNMVRIPVAFWMFIPTEGDEPYWTDSRQKDVYLVQLVEWALQYGMEVLIDIHALPGGQNTDQESGRDLVTAGLDPTFYNSTNLLRGNDTVDAVIEWVQGLPANLSANIAMIELVNEPTVGYDGFYEALVGYYIANQAKIADKLPNVWTVVSDAWLGTESWGDVFNTSQNVVMDLHWWMMFGTPPTLTQLETTYCNVTGPNNANAWQNPVIVGEFAAAQNNINLYTGMNSIQKLQFYQEYYSTQLWAARGSGGQFPLYRGGFLWSMVCTNCGSVWQPYYVAGDWDTLAVTGPNWCNSSTPSPTVTPAINPLPTRLADSCGIYSTVGDAAISAATSSSSSVASSTGAAGHFYPLNTRLMVVMLLVTIGFVMFGQKACSGEMQVACQDGIAYHAEVEPKPRLELHHRSDTWERRSSAENDAYPSRALLSSVLQHQQDDMVASVLDVF